MLRLNLFDVQTNWNILRICFIYYFKVDIMIKSQCKIMKPIISVQVQ